jgi:hypothetical protein
MAKFLSFDRHSVGAAKFWLLAIGFWLLAMTLVQVFKLVSKVHAGLQTSKIPPAK